MARPIRRNRLDTTPQFKGAFDEVVCPDNFLAGPWPAIYWGPDQRSNEEDVIYSPPPSWRHLEGMRVPKVVRFIYDDYEHEYITPDGDDPGSGDPQECEGGLIYDESYGSGWTQKEERVYGEWYVPGNNPYHHPASPPNYPILGDVAFLGDMSMEDYFAQYPPRFGASGFAHFTMNGVEGDADSARTIISDSTIDPTTHTFTVVYDGPGAGAMGFLGAQLHTITRYIWVRTINFQHCRATPEGSEIADGSYEFEYPFETEEPPDDGAPILQHIFVQPGGGGGDGGS